MRDSSGERQGQEGQVRQWGQMSRPYVRPGLFTCCVIYSPCVFISDAILTQAAFLRSPRQRREGGGEAHPLRGVGELGVHLARWQWAVLPWGRGPVSELALRVSRRSVSTEAFIHRGSWSTGKMTQPRAADATRPIKNKKQKRSLPHIHFC